MLPLEGIRILDMTRLLPGAIATMMMHDMGAEIIKIEDPNGGDYARWTPPLHDGTGAFFKASNRGKKSLILDLKRDEGRAIFYRLVQDADVVIEGFRPQVTKRLGVDYDSLQAINPRIVYASLSGWGATGPRALMSGHDLNYVALSGLLGAGRADHPLGGQIADVGGAYASVSAILASLLRRERTRTGAYVDVALYEASMPFAMYQFVESNIGATRGGAGSLTGGMAYYQIYKSADDLPMAFAPIEPKFWANFCNAVGKPDWLERHNADQQALYADLSALFATRTRQAWADLLAEADCCWSIVTDPANLSQDAHVQARGMAGTDANGVPFLRSPIHIDGLNNAPIKQSPAYGEHTRAILQQAGYTPAQIEAWIASGVVKDQQG